MVKINDEVSVVTGENVVRDTMGAEKNDMIRATSALLSNLLFWDSLSHHEYFNGNGTGSIQQDVIDDLANAINFGKVNVADLPVEYIVRDGNILILNTRTSQALTQAGIPRSQWNAIDRTGEALEGISTVRSSGGQ